MSSKLDEFHLLTLRQIKLAIESSVMTTNFCMSESEFEDILTAYSRSNITKLPNKLDLVVDEEVNQVVS